jgi:hydrogenase maturation factor
LLICVSAGDAPEIIAALKEGGISASADIGEVLEDPQEKIWVA